MCLQEVQGGGASQRLQVYSDVFCYASGAPPTELRPPTGHTQSHQHDNYGGNTPVVITRKTNTTLINATTADTPSTSSSGPNTETPDQWQPHCTVGNVVQPSISVHMLKTFLLHHIQSFKSSWQRCLPPSFRFCSHLHSPGQSLRKAGVTVGPSVSDNGFVATFFKT